MSLKLITTVVSNSLSISRGHGSAILDQKVHLIANQSTHLQYSLSKRELLTEPMMKTDKVACYPTLLKRKNSLIFYGRESTLRYTSHNGWEKVNIVGKFNGPDGIVKY